MSLDAYISNAPDSTQSRHADPLAQLSQSFLYEAQQELTGLVQLADRSNKVEAVLAPDAPTTQGAEHAQMIGRAAADLIPIVVTGLAMRFGLGRVLPHSAAHEVALAQRSVLGLTLAETGATGFLTGSLLKPSDEQARESMPDLLWDRTKGGISGALSFSTLAGINSATVWAGEKITWELGRKIVTNPLATAFLSGAPAGLANAEIDSLVNKGQFTTSGAEIGKSIYEMTFLGTAFAGIGMALHRAPAEPANIASEPGAQEAQAASVTVPILESVEPQKLPGKKQIALSGWDPDQEAPVIMSADGFEYEHKLYSMIFGKPNKVHATLDPEVRSQLPELLANATKNGPQGEASNGAGPAPSQRAVADAPTDSAIGASAPVEAATAQLHREGGTSEASVAIDFGIYFTQSEGAPQPIVRNEPALNEANAAFETVHPEADWAVHVHDKATFGPTDAHISTAEQASIAHDLGKSPESKVTTPEEHLQSIYKRVTEVLNWRAAVSQEQLADRAQALESLSKHFQDEPKLLEALKRQPSSLYPELAAFLDEGPQSRNALLLRELNEHSGNVSVPDLRSLERLLSIFGPESPAAIRLLESPERDGFEALENFIKEKPDEHAKQLEKLLESGADWYEIDGKLLSAFEVLKDKLGPDSDAIKQLLNLNQKRLRLWQEGELIGEKDAFPDHASDSNPDHFSWEEMPTDWLTEDDWLADTEPTEAQSEDAQKDSPDPSLSKTTLIELSSFLKDGDENKIDLITRLLAQGRYRDLADSSRLELLEKIEGAFGADSPTTRRLLSLENAEWELDLDDLTAIIDSHPNFARTLRRLIDEGANAEQLNPDRIAALARIEELYGSETSTTERLFQLEKQDLDLESLVCYIEHSYGYDWLSPQQETPPEAIEESKRRAAVVKTLVDFGAPAEHLDSDRLNAFDSLTKTLGADSPLLQKLLESESKEGLGLLHVDAAMREWSYDFGKTVPLSQKLLEKLLDLSPDVKTLDGLKLRGLQGSVNTFGENNLPALVKVQADGLDLNRLWNFAASARERRVPMIADLLKDGATAAQLEVDRLAGLELLENRYQKGSPVVAKLLSLENDDSFIAAMGALSQNDARAATLKSLIESDASPAHLEPGRVKGLSKLETIYGEGSPALARFLDLEKQGANLKEIADFLKCTRTDPEYFSESDSDKVSSTNKALLEKWIDEKTPPDRFNFAYLSSLKNLTERFGSDSPTLARIVELERQVLNLKGLREFIDEDPEKHKLIVETLINNNASAPELSYNRLQAISILLNKLGADKPAFNHIFKLEKEGLSLPSLVKYISDDEKPRIAQIKKLLADEAPLKELNTKHLADASMLERLNKHFGNDPEAMTTMSRIGEMQKEGLSASRLLRYIDEKREARRELVGRLVKANTSIDVINDHMRLSVFSEPVAEKLVAASRRDGMNVAQILGALRDWRSGMYFRDLVQEHVESGGALGEKEMIALQHRAKDAAQVAAQDSHGSEPQAVTYSRHVPAKAADLAKILQEATVKIDETIPKDQPIVLLGRDNWPLYPLLKAQGRNVQYFLWSRLHEVDDRTARQWLKEVPHGAAVIDTGYHGSILDAVRRIDPSAKGYLLSSSGHYPQLLRDTDHSDMVGALEYFPKLIGRSKTYTENGGAVSRNATRDGDEAGIGKMDRHHRWFVQGATRDLMRAMSLPDWYVWRFSEYTGLTPGERLGLNSQVELDQHYRRVSESRGGN